MNYIPDPMGCCPVCHESWDAGGGKSRIKEIHHLQGPQRERWESGRTVGRLIGYQCPFCKTMWEV